MRDKHTFQFTGKQVGDAAARMSAYHVERQEHWQDRYAAAVEKAKTAGVKVIEWEHSNGKDARLEVDGDITRELSLCAQKRDGHKKSAEQFRLEANAYLTQPTRTYELDPGDVVYFKLSGGEMPE